MNKKRSQMKNEYNSEVEIPRSSITLADAKDHGSKNEGIKIQVDVSDILDDGLEEQSFKDSI